MFTLNNTEVSGKWSQNSKAGWNPSKVSHKSLLHIRASIDQPFLWELSASLNLVIDRAAHAVYDHSCSWLCMPPTQTPGHSPSPLDCNLTLTAPVLTRRLTSQSYPAAHSRAAAALQQASSSTAHSLYLHTLTVRLAHCQHCFVCV